MANISPRQFGTRPVPMPSTVGSFGSGSSGMRPAPMPTKAPGMIGGFGGTNRSVPMPTRIFGR